MAFAATCSHRPPRQRGARGAVKAADKNNRHVRDASRSGTASECFRSHGCTSLHRDRVTKPERPNDWTIAGQVEFRPMNVIVE